MQIVIKNLTGSTKTYLSGAISVAGSGSTTVTTTSQLVQLCIDGQLRSDLFASAVQITDGVNTYAANDATDYMDRILMAFASGIYDSSGVGVTLGQKLMATSIPVVLPSDQSLTLSSSRDEVNQQIANGNAYSVISPEGGISVGATETGEFYFKNNSGTKTVYFFDLYVVQEPANGNNWLEARVYYGPTVSVNGTAVSINNMLAGSSNVSSANAYTAPTVSAFGKLVELIVAGFNNAAAAATLDPSPHYYILPPGQSLLVTGNGKGNGTQFYVIGSFFEV